MPPEKPPRPHLFPPLHHLLNTLFSFLVFFGLLFLYTKVAGPIPFSVNSVTTNKTDSFTVSGIGKSSIKPDKATITVGVSAQGSSAKVVQDNITQNISKVSSAIGNLGIGSEDIQTSNFNINPIQDFSSNPPKITGYSANTNLTIKIKDISKINQIIDAATNNGATQVGGVSFDNVDKSKAENEAREMAVKEAKQKADQAAKIAGFTLGKIINYSEDFGGNIRPLAVGAIALDSKISNTNKIEPGENEVVVTVSLSYEIR